ncbi:hypothetical protein BIV57_07720 [Mangrovactinospora gilvigrisea]|uniref:Phytoene/squalene synthetase n=1 Tax=Mangrovactinospora gilvigrisea TaxID=1428644 RepID=A0A1J7BHB5_9ACTN|nr:squalene/phytoene synthase family protein [Mangrovactinospora gilvigrisea]OIV38046.1 hypothetical protein BIV57_07720 [Mangrovactinospora gilvigrisea]
MSRPPRRWSRALDAAGITEAGLRDDYTRQRALVIGYKPAAALAVQLLLPRGLVPHALAATAYMHRSDNILEGDGDETLPWPDWERRTRDALASPGAAGDATLRALGRTVRAHPALAGHLDTYLPTATTDRDTTGFATEDDYQRYLDAYSLPAFMLVAGVLGADRAACRTFIDAGQRLDFVNDLSEDLPRGRLGIPADALAAHGVTRADLERRRDTPAVRALLAAQLDRAAAAMAAARGPLLATTPPAGRRLVRMLLALDRLTLAAARRGGASLLSAPASPSKPRVLAALAACAIA